ncbi:hypothetical protein MTR_1g058200 [Medicago truncatula]|uniref:RNA-directed DNA polymerase n=1 Tax=Medicago truncatula TaxID=3880 RepID=A0A072VK26_MEDTR|nr:hypothetical protein MTR_1g058200 [Medicago truncatula]
MLWKHLRGTLKRTQRCNQDLVIMITCQTTFTQPFQNQGFRKTQILPWIRSCLFYAYHNASLRFLKYLKVYPSGDLFFPRNPPVHLQGFSDADWIGCKDTRRSISGLYFYLGNSLISWRTKKYLTISRSSSAAEYCALAASIEPHLIINRDCTTIINK